MLSPTSCVVLLERGDRRSHGNVHSHWRSQQTQFRAKSFDPLVYSAWNSSYFVLLYVPKISKAVSNCFLVKALAAAYIRRSLFDTFNLAETCIFLMLCLRQYLVGNTRERAGMIPFSRSDTKQISSEDIPLKNFFKFSKNQIQFNYFQFLRCPRQ